MLNLQRRVPAPSCRHASASRVRPFSGPTASRRPTVHVKAAEPEVYDAEDYADVQMTEEDRKAAQAAADLVMPSLLAEMAAESIEIPEMAEQGMDITSRISDIAGAQMPDDLAEALAHVANVNIDSLPELEIEDYQGPEGFRKYDEEEENAVTEEDREQIAPFKLSRQELASLVPEDWATVNIDWFTSKKEDKIPLPEYRLTFLWQEKNIAVAVDQVYSRGQVSPLTEFFVWPRKDAWEELKAALELRPWMSERDRVVLLNRLTEVINFWQDETTKHSIDEARTQFPDCSFA